jgi:hypothetical protein
MTSWTLDDLHGALITRGALPGADPPELAVASVTSDSPGRALVLDIDTPTKRGRQRWRLTLDHALADLRDDGASLDSAALVVRANIEEWWHLKDVEPATGRMGVLVES